MAKQSRKKERILKKNMREKKRYLLIQGDKKQVNDAILEFSGFFGKAKACPTWVKNNVLSIDRKMLDEVKSALELKNIQIKKVSSTLKGLK